MKSVLQDWVMELGLRHQGVLLTAVRGCDTAPKSDISKAVQRAFRGAILNAHCGDAKKSGSFIEWFPGCELTDMLLQFRKNHDHYPHHYIMHVVHAAEIVGYYHPDLEIRNCWRNFYLSMAKSFHMWPESNTQMDDRLSADEKTFVSQQ